MLILCWITIPLHHTASPHRRKEDTNEPAPRCECCPSREEGKKRGQEKHREPQGGGRKKGFGDGSAGTDAGFEGGDTVYGALQLLEEVLALYAVMGMNNRYLGERGVERRRWRYHPQ